MQAPRKQSGFTIIELVVVILLLGILAATALPRFVDVTDEAHAAVAEATYGGFGTGVAMARAQWVADGQSGTSVSLRGGTVSLNGSGYPNGATNGECQTTFDTVLQDGHPTVGDGGSVSDGTTDTLFSDTGDLTDIDTQLGTSTGSDFVAVHASDASGSEELHRCYYFYTAQYADHDAADTAGADGIPYFYYDEANGDAVYTSTGNLPAP
ncbi:MAG: type II secretion system protein [Pseudohongiellaceae bacterium]